MELSSNATKNQTINEEDFLFFISSLRPSLLKQFNNTRETSFLYDYELKNNSNNLINSQVPFTNDTLDIPNTNNSQNNIKYKANFLKYLFFKKNINRFQTEYFDLDLSFITKKVIAMGSPCTGFKSLFQNSLNDVRNFLERNFKSYKVYNITSDKNKIYQKSHFNIKRLTVFPFPNDKPCPIQLMLDFCIDVVLYLSNNDGVVVIHCDDGLEKTGTLICCYLLFSGLCQNTTEAVLIFNERRCSNEFKAISSHHINYINFFEEFLKVNFYPPYIDELNTLQNDTVIIENNKQLYTFSFENNIQYKNENYFQLKNVLIGPFDKDDRFSFVFSANDKNAVENFFPNSYLSKEYRNNFWYYRIIILSEKKINYDLKLEMKNSRIKFAVWINFFFATMKIISKHLDEIHTTIKDTTPIPFNFDSNVNEIIEHINCLSDEKGMKYINKDKLSFVFEKNELDLIKDNEKENLYKVVFIYSLKIKDNL